MYSSDRRLSAAGARKTIQDAENVYRSTDCDGRASERRGEPADPRKNRHGDGLRLDLSAPVVDRCARRHAGQVRADGLAVGLRIAGEHHAAGHHPSDGQVLDDAYGSA